MPARAPWEAPRHHRNRTEAHKTRSALESAWARTLLARRSGWLGLLELAPDVVAECRIFDQIGRGARQRVGGNQHGFDPPLARRALGETMFVTVRLALVADRHVGMDRRD